ncbi:MAG: DUF6371 domain-containing protein [Bacteroidota bacterium]|nr:DUF6371 domain-containing protein [Bacteroidota bacterium]
MYFEKNGGSLIKPYLKKEFSKINIESNIVKPISNISNSIFEKSLSNNKENNFIKYLEGLFGSRLTSKLIKLYSIGSSKYWKGATVFWQVDISGKIRTGKIMLYNPDTGKRIKEPINHIAWAHSALNLKDFNLKQCFFGEHLLNASANKPIAIVEAEKTAIIASVYLPEFIWLATGSLSNLNLEKFKVLSKREIYLFPDLNCYTKWKLKALEIKEALACKIFVSDFLETNASTIEKEKGYDIADYLIVRDEKFGWALSGYSYPIFWDH